MQMVKNKPWNPEDLLEIYVEFLNASATAGSSSTNMLVFSAIFSFLAFTLSSTQRANCGPTTV